MADDSVRVERILSPSEQLRLARERAGSPPLAITGYKAVVHDYAVARTMEMQTSLLAATAARVWNLWNTRRTGLLSDAEAETLQLAMNGLHHELRDTDIFMAGVAAGRAQS